MSKKNKGIWWLPYTWVAAFIGGTAYRLYSGGKMADALIDGACAFGAVYLLMTFITLVCFAFSKEGKNDRERRRTKLSHYIWALILAACIWYEESLLMGFLIFIILFLVYAVAFFLCASVIGDKSDSYDIGIHDKKIMEENLKTWNRMNRKFRRKCNREIDKEIEEMSEPKNGRNYYDFSDSILKE